MQRAMFCWKTILILIWVLIILALLYQLVIRERTSWTVNALVGDRNAEVTIYHSRNRILFQLGHEILIGGGGNRYTTVVRFRDRQELKFRTESEPKAIWELDGKLFVACSGCGWSLVKLDTEGNVERIRPSQLPEGPRPWNLVEQSKEMQEYWERDFSMSIPFLEDPGPPLPEDPTEAALENARRMSRGESFEKILESQGSRPPQEDQKQ